MKESRNLAGQNQNPVRSSVQQWRKERRVMMKNGMYVVDLFHMELSLGATILDQVPKSKIPLVWTISRKTRELFPSQHLQFLFPLP